MEPKVVESSKSALGPIPYETLMRIHGLFLNHKREILQTSTGEEETKSIWFENNPDFQNFLNDILDPGKNISGLRVYLCEHDQESVPNDVADKPGYVNRLTVGFVPTRLNESTGKHEDHPEAVSAGLLLTVPYDQGKICPPDICP